MIFLTVGFELPFDRLVRAVDQWCVERRRRDVFGQIADPGTDGYKPFHFQWTAFLPPNRLKQRFLDADLIIAHAGMGSIITALSVGKPILIMPRRAALRETRNDHQFHTAKRFCNRAGVFVAEAEEEIGPELDRLSARRDLGGEKGIQAFAEPALIEAVRSVILGTHRSETQSS